MLERGGGVAALAAAVITVFAAAPAARAADVSATCADLQTKLSAAGTGDVVTLTESCTGTAFTLPSAAITLRGAAPGITLDGTGAGGGAGLSGTGVQATTIENLTIRDFSQGGLRFTGNSGPTLRDLVVQGNGGYGGISVSSGVGDVLLERVTLGGDGAGQGNSSTDAGGGAIIEAHGAITVRDSQVIGNEALTPGAGLGGGVRIRAFTPASGTPPVTIERTTFRGNAAGKSGGGLHVTLSADRPATLTANRLEGNRVATSSQGPGGGGGAEIQRTAPGTPLTLAGNLIAGNTVEWQQTEDAYGGGLRIVDQSAADPILLRGDRIVGNRVVSEDQSDGASGAGLHLSHDLAAGVVQDVRLEGVVLAGNVNEVTGTGTLGPGDVTPGGAAIALDECDFIAPCGTALTLVNTTVAGQTAGAGATATAIDGDLPGHGGDVESDTLTLRNSILAGNGPAAIDEIGGFATTTAQSTLACTLAAAPLPGAGNLCADPKLAAPAAAEPDVRLLAGSPAIDAGDDALVPAALTTDVFGAPRIADGDGNGVARVDLGAVERPGPVPPVPPAPPAPPAPAPPAAAKDSTAPAISGLRLTSRTLRPAGKPGPRRPKAPPRTTTFRFRLSEAATVRIAFAPVVRRKARRAVGTLVRPGVKAGDVRVAFSGRLGRRVLRPGTYRATLTATDAAGNRSRPVIVTLTVVR